MVALMRVVLAVSGLTVVTLVPAGPEHFASPVSLALVIYAVYSIAVWLFELKGVAPTRALSDWGHWIDVVCYTSLIALSRGTVSIFFWYFFPILVASFRWGFWAGIRVVLTSAILPTLVGLWSAPPGGEVEQQRFLIRPIYFVTVGYMMAYWGGAEVRLRRRMSLLQEVGAISNPRFGVDRTLGVIMNRLIHFYQADGCTIITTDPVTGGASLRRSGRASSEEAARHRAIPSEVAVLLLSAPGSKGVVYSASTERPWLGAGAVCRAFELFDPANAPIGPDAGDGAGAPSAGDGIDVASCEAIATALDAQAFVSVPLSFRNRISGRIFLTVDSPRVFDASDARFLKQAVDQVLPLVDNISLVNQLASDAAEEERRKIARDIHDSVIQPYVGLQIGLAGLREKLAANGSELSGDMERLMEMTNQGITDLRRQVSALKEKGGKEGSLLPAVWRFATRFTEATGIAVQVEAEADIQVEDRLAAEAFQMVAEGLSNVRRHTGAAHATVGLACRDGSLHLRIENEGTRDSLAPFVPRSLSERAAALGGAAQVLRRENGTTVVSIEVPL
jgi:signal transduction histidine kinase